MNKVEAINAECREGMVNTELAFIEAGRQAAMQARNSTSDSLQAMPMPLSNGFFAGHASTDVTMMAAAQQ